MDITEYIDYFHDGIFLGVKKKGNNVELFLQSCEITDCKRKMIMSPFSKVEMSPLLGLMALEAPYEGKGKDECKRSRTIVRNEEVG